VSLLICLYHVYLEIINFIIFYFDEVFFGLASNSLLKKNKNCIYLFLYWCYSSYCCHSFLYWCYSSYCYHLFLYWCYSSYCYHLFLFWCYSSYCYHLFLYWCYSSYCYHLFLYWCYFSYCYHLFLDWFYSSYCYHLFLDWFYSSYCYHLILYWCYSSYCYDLCLYILNHYFRMQVNSHNTGCIVEIQMHVYSHSDLLISFIFEFYPERKRGVKSKNVKAQLMCKFAQLYACHELFRF
jgi:hypothetical protein